MFASKVATVLRHASVNAMTRHVSLRFPSTRPSIVYSTSLCIRPFSQVTLTFVDSEGQNTTVQANEGQSLLDVAHEHDIELEGACGGELACSTCHLIFEKRIFQELPEMTEEEEDMLDLAWGLTDTSRLGCQIKVMKYMEGMTVQIPDETENLM